MRDEQGELDFELFDLRQRLMEAESDGAEIALHAEKNMALLRNEIAMLREANKHSVDGYCVECKWRLLIIAETAGGLLGFLWFRQFPLPAADDLTRIFGTCLTVFPGIWVLGQWYEDWFNTHYRRMKKDDPFVQMLFKKLDKFLR